MGVRTRGHDLAGYLQNHAADQAADLAAGRDVVIADDPGRPRGGTPWLDVYCPGCGTIRALDLRAIDRHPLASVGSLVLGLRCSWCPGSAPMPRIVGLHALPPAASGPLRSRRTGNE